MNLKEAIQSKTLELETALELQKPHEGLLKIYKELKELQYKKVREEMPDVQTNSKQLIESPAGLRMRICQFNGVKNNLLDNLVKKTMVAFS